MNIYKKTLFATIGLGALFTSLSATSAVTPTFCSAFKESAILEAYVVEDGVKPYSALKSEIASLEDQVSKELLKPTPNTALINELNTLISKKKNTLSQKIDYQSAINAKQREIRLKEKEKQKLHDSVIKVISVTPLDTAAMSNLCGSYSVSPYSCAKESAIEVDINTLNMELSQQKKAYQTEKSWNTRSIVTQQGQFMTKQQNMGSASLGIFGVGINQKSMSLNKDGDGISGSIENTATRFYSCAPDQLTVLPTKVIDIQGMPIIIQKSALPSQIDIFFCAKTFLGEGECSTFKQLMNGQNKGWESYAIDKNNPIVENSYHQDHVKIKSTCNNIGTSSEACRMDIRLFSMGDVNKDNLSVKTQSLLSTNPSYSKIVDQAISPGMTQTFNTQKEELHNQTGCSYNTIEAASGTDVPASALISCKAVRTDKNGTPITTTDANGNVVFDRVDKSVQTNLLDCPVVEKCLVEKTITEPYTEGCVSPFPIDRVVVRTDIPEGNCAIKFDKEAYVCDAKRVLDNRECHIQRTQTIESCEAKMTTAYQSLPFYGSITAGVKAFSLINDYTALSENGATGPVSELSSITTLLSGGTFNGEVKAYITLMNLKDDLDKYLRFRISVAHKGGRYGLFNMNETTSYDKMVWSHQNYSYFAIDMTDSSAGIISTPALLGNAPDGKPWLTLGRGALTEKVEVFYGCARTNSKVDPLWQKVWWNDRPYCTSIYLRPSGSPLTTVVEVSKELTSAGTTKIASPYGLMDLDFYQVTTLGSNDQSIPPHVKKSCGENGVEFVKSYTRDSTITNHYVTPLVCARPSSTGLFLATYQTPSETITRVDGTYAYWKPPANPERTIGIFRDNLCRLSNPGIYTEIIPAADPKSLGKEKVGSTGPVNVTEFYIDCSNPNADQATKKSDYVYYAWDPNIRGIGPKVITKVLEATPGSAFYVNSVPNVDGTVVNGGNGGFKGKEIPHIETTKIVSSNTTACSPMESLRK